MLFAKIFLWAIAFVMFTGIIADKDLSNRKICATVFIVCVVCATALQLVPLFLG